MENNGNDGVLLVPDNKANKGISDRKNTLQFTPGAIRRAGHQQSNAQPKLTMPDPQDLIVEIQVLETLIKKQKLEIARLRADLNQRRDALIAYLEEGGTIEGLHTATIKKTVRLCLI